MPLTPEISGAINMSETILYISFEELCEPEAIKHEWVLELIDYGIATPVTGSSEKDWYFDMSSVVWLKKAVRLYCELEIDWVAVALIIELLKQKQALAQENQSLQSQLKRFHHA
jgi:chaperone modulatory protein CbpM